MAAARAVITATRLGVVGALAEEHATAQKLAAKLGLDAVGTEALLTALAALGYLQATADGKYSPTAEGLRLVAGGSDSLANFVGAYSAHAWEMLGGLDEVLQGERTAASHRRPPGDPFWEPYIRGLFELTRDEHDQAAALVDVSEPRELLDVGGGHAGFAMAMCRRHPGLQATVLDLPVSAAVGRRIVAEEGFEARISFREGDAMEADLGEDLDVISMFNLLHHLPAPDVQALLRRVYASLRAGGCLVVGETERTEPGAPASPFGALSGLIYFASSGTRNYTRAELTGWLEQAGFHTVNTHRSETSPWRLVYGARRQGALPRPRLAEKDPCSPGRLLPCVNAVVVRVARAGEEERLLPLYEWLFEAPGRRPAQWDPERAAVALREAIESDRATVLVAEAPAGELAGICVAYQDINSIRFGHRVWVEDLVVRPDLRSQGAGARLVSSAREWARERGATHFELDTGQARRDTQRFYERLGPDHQGISYTWDL